MHMEGHQCDSSSEFGVKQAPASCPPLGSQLRTENLPHILQGKLCVGACGNLVLPAAQGGNHSKCRVYFWKIYDCHTSKPHSPIQHLLAIKLCVCFVNLCNFLDYLPILGHSNTHEYDPSHSLNSWFLELLSPCDLILHLLTTVTGTLHKFNSM